MKVFNNSEIKTVHCVGIGGIGVSAIAELLLRQGHRVTGSDVHSSACINRLQKLGIKIYLGHHEKNIGSPDLVVYSSAVDTSNPEIAAAKKAHIPIIKRGEMLAELMNSRCNIVIAGTHGKTTTCGLVANLLTVANLNPTYAVGGILNNGDSPVALGDSNYFVAEADESDASFLYLNPDIVVITNIEADHLETYAGDYAELKKSFQQFLQKIPKHGLAILCFDDPAALSLVNELNCRVITYGFDSRADFSVQQFNQCELQTKFIVKKNGSVNQQFQLNLPGKHNVQNALAAFAIAHELGIQEEVIAKAFIEFPGVRRRFYAHGKICLSQGHALLFDDYGHHPSEIKATLDAVRLAWPERRIVLVFQPHRYSRTRDLMQDFVNILMAADLLLITEVYAASEAKIQGADAKTLCEIIKKQSGKEPIYVPDLLDIPRYVLQHIQADDIVILQGAGNINQIAEKLLTEK